MGKVDKYIKRQQEIMQKSQIFNPCKNRPINYNSFFFYGMSDDTRGQLKLAEDLMKRKK